MLVKCIQNDYSLEQKLQSMILSHGREIPIIASVGGTEEQFGTHWFPISL